MMYLYNRLSRMTSDLHDIVERALTSTTLFGFGAPHKSKEWDETK